MSSDFLRDISLERLGKGPVEIAFSATDEERQGLVERFAILDLPRFEGVLRAQREEDGTVVLDGSLSAEAVQACVVTLEPVAETVAEEFHVRFVPGLEPAPIDEEDLEGLAEMEDQEPLEGDAIAAGEIAAQYLALSLNPYPRKAGVEAGELEIKGAKVLSEDEAKSASSPFAVLKKN